LESLNTSLRKVIQTRGSFPTEEAALKLLFLALERAAKKWTRPIQDWKAALNRFAILYEDRLPLYGSSRRRPRRPFATAAAPSPRYPARSYLSANAVWHAIFDIHL
jgi:hypothetical protein